MADMLSTGVSGLAAFQRALDTVSHNIANANTDGYSRQIANLSANAADQYGGNYIGNGVSVASIRRLYDQALTDQMRSAGSTMQQLEVFSSYSDRIDKLFSDTSTGLSASMQQFNNALEAVATSPTSTTARQVLISQAQTLVNRFRSFQGSLSSIDSQIATETTSEAAAVSSLAKSIADLNKQIIAAQGTGLAAPNDLLDKRDQAIAQLSDHLAVTTVAEGSGALNVFIGSGQVLVQSTVAATLNVAPGEFNRADQRLTLSGYATPVDVTNVVSGGKLGGLMQLRSELLVPTENSLGQLATAVATLANQQHKAGLDLAGNPGGDLFSIGGVAALPSTRNTGSSALTVTRSSIAALTTGNYQMRFNGTVWNMTRTDTGASIALGGAGTLASPFTADGLSIVVSGTPLAGDAFQVEPTSQAVSGMQVLVTTPDKIAVAAPLLTGATSGNTGTGTIDAGQVTTPASWVRDNYRLQFTSTSNWQVLNSANAVVASGAYSAGGNINFNGMRVVVSGAPASGDSFTINDNGNGDGDGRNARALLDLFNSQTLNGGTTSLADAVSRMVGSIGVQTSQAQTGRDAQSVVLNDATTAVQNLSGVNLDEEAANLVRFQHAYQAAAKVIAAANDMFNTLLNATK
jgi:flagellar hook-associated protein 1